MKTAIFVSALAFCLAGPAEAQFGSSQGPVTKGPQPKVLPTTKAAPQLPPSNIRLPGGTLFGGGDDCTAPTPVVGQGNFTFDNSAATTGAEGQNETICDAFGTTGIDNDVWFEWTADADGLALIETCGTTFDTKVAIYPAGGCPAVDTSLACNDDACGLQSQITLQVTTGTSYLLQIGNFPGAGGGQGVWNASIFPPVGNDDCATPEVIAGQGSFAFNMLGATTGAEGQGEFLCNFFGSTVVDNDIWYEWTADATGLAVISTCGSTVDTKAALYLGTGCPGAGSALACNDDSCGLQTELVASVVAGTTYTIQLGTFPGASGGVGNFDITIFPPLSNDECTSPDLLMGQGVFPYSNIGATTGTDGQSEGLCFAFGTSGIDNDVWFEWTADADGLALIRTCGQTTNDTKLAAYPAAGCPGPGSALACNDDACGLQSTIALNVTSGDSYLVQVGNFPGASAGSGALDISIIDLPEGYAYDLGVSSNSIGLTAGGGIGWLHGFSAEGGSDTISEVSSAFGTPAFPGLSPSQPGSVAIWDDPTNDFDPSDAVLLYSTPITTSNEDTDVLNAYPIPNVTVNGVFFVGVVVNNFAGEFPAPLDETFPSSGRAWIVGNTSGAGGFGAFDLGNLLVNDVPPADLDSIFLPGVFLLRAEGLGGGLGTPYCTSAPNSVSINGSRMAAEGSTSLADMNLTLRADNAPTQPGLFFFGPSQLQIPFGNGFRCVGGQVVRMPVVLGTGGSFEYPIDFGLFGPDLTSLGTANFQCWYRDPADGGTNFNLSNGLEVVFSP